MSGMRWACLVWLAGLAFAGASRAQTCKACDGKGGAFCEPCRGSGEVTKDLTYGGQVVAAGIAARCVECLGGGALPCTTCAGRKKLLASHELCCTACRGRGLEACPQCRGMRQVVVVKGIQGKVTAGKCRRCGGDGVLKCQECRSRRVLEMPFRLAEPDAFTCPACPGFPDLRKGERGGLKCLLCRGDFVLRLSGLYERVRELERMSNETGDRKDRAFKVWSAMEQRRASDYPLQWRPANARLGVLVALRELSPHETGSPRQMAHTALRRWFGDRPLGRGVVQEPPPVDVLEEARKLQPEARAAFESMDTGKKGKVGAVEVGTYFTDPRSKKPLVVDPKAFAVYDADRDGAWDALEFATWWVAQGSRLARPGPR